MGALNDFNECSQNSAPATPDAPPQTQSGDRRCRSSRGCPRARPLARGLADRGSFHPLRAVSDPRDDLSGHAVAISSNDPGLRALLRRMAADLRLTPLDVPESGRRAYHAGASIAAGGLVSLASAAVSALVRAGVDERSATRALLPLMRSAIGGIERRGLRGALTGPIIRGDWEVVDQHLQALPSDLRNLYLSLAQQSLRLASPSLSSEATRALRRVLQAWRRLLKRRE